MNGNKIIVHALIKLNNKFLVLKRSENESTYPNYWDIPGGLVNDGEMPKEAVIRETKEEVGLDISVYKIIHEDSNLDTKKNLIFIRLVYIGETINTIEDIKLDLNEHSEYKLISSLDDLSNEKISPFLIELFEKDLKCK